MKIKKIMTREPAFATVNTSLHEVAQLMAENDCGCLPVVDSNADLRPIGMITDRDITIRTVAHNKNPLNMIAGEIMTDNPITATPDTSVEECIRLMERNQIRRIAVVDDLGNLCGMISQADIAINARPRETAELVKDVSMLMAA